MNIPRLAVAAVLVPFTVFSTVVTWREGYARFFTGPWTDPIWAQEFLDLCIALTIVCVWMVGDARRRGATVWPYVAATPLLGSIAPLCYLLLRAPVTEQAAPART
ncbi:MAG: DUF2834 domain-containing protein [Planctomycetota bacterium]|nr:DUF2834 domain-containing protein [Planctomycetota bacterium]